jgi:hypothetical protein
MVRPVPPATGRETRILSTVDQGRKRPEAEEQQEEDGEAAPHVISMLAENKT